VRVSDKCNVRTFAVNHQVGFKRNETPFVFAAVELAGQRGLFGLTNMVGTPQIDSRSACQCACRSSTRKTYGFPSSKLTRHE
jgi:hypothetical protein